MISSTDQESFDSQLSIFMPAITYELNLLVQGGTGIYGQPINTCESTQDDK